MKTLLLALILFMAITASISGILLVINTDGTILKIPTSILDGSPFKNFLIPGIMFVLVVGGVNLIAAIKNIQHSSNRYNWAIAGGSMICGWIVLQLILIQITHWLQYIYLGIGLIIILLAYQLKGKWAV
jgi:p-aminobenzoyl-glutamate transporter AbgT